MPSTDGTSISRRDILAGTASLAATAVAGCTALGRSDEDARAYRLDGEHLDAESLAKHTLWTPSDETEWGRQATDALHAAIRGERPTAYGYEPIRADEYVEVDETYYRTDVVVTGRKRLSRWVLRLHYPGSVPEDATVKRTSTLPTIDRRAAMTAYLGARARRGGGDAPDRVEHGGYVYRPVGDRQVSEESSLLPSPSTDYIRFDGRKETLRVEVIQKSLHEPAYTAIVTPVANSLSGLESIVASTMLDANLDRDALDEASREILRKGVAGDGYTETAPLSDAYTRVLGTLGLDIDRPPGTTQGYLRWGGEYYQYLLVVDTPE